MHDPDTAEIEPEGKGLEPVDPLSVEVRVGRDLIGECLVLLPILGGVAPHELTRALRIGGGKRDRVELVVPHHNLGAAHFDHGSDDLECLDLLTASVDEVTDEDSLTILTRSDMAVGAILLLVAELVQESFQEIGASVDVTDDVIADHAPSVSRPKPSREG